MNQNFDEDKTLKTYTYRNIKIYKVEDRTKLGCLYLHNK